MGLFDKWRAKSAAKDIEKLKAQRDALPAGDAKRAEVEQKLKATEEKLAQLNANNAKADKKATGEKVPTDNSQLKMGFFTKLKKKWQTATGWEKFGIIAAVTLSVLTLGAAGIFIAVATGGLSISALGTGITTGATAVANGLTTAATTIGTGLGATAANAPIIGGTILAASAATALVGIPLAGYGIYKATESDAKKLDREIKSDAKKGQKEVVSKELQANHSTEQALTNAKKADIAKEKAERKEAVTGRRIEMAQNKTGEAARTADFHSKENVVREQQQVKFKENEAARKAKSSERPSLLSRTKDSILAAKQIPTAATK